VLQTVPGSRLLLKGHGFDGAGMRDRLAARFAAVGVDSSRVEMIDRTRSALAHLELYARVDVALDPYPYHGTTTTCEALWMGRPVVTLAGEWAGARQALSILAAMDLERWTATDVPTYVQTASALARAHSSGVTVHTDRRDWRINCISARRGSALIAVSVTGRSNRTLGFTFTAAHLPVSSVGSVIPATLMVQMPTTSSPSRE
jgi:predicted O-linked N-acetylglucosamine transferase (SPINDLY family)